MSVVHAAPPKYLMPDITTPEAKAEFFAMTLAMQAKARPRYESTAHLFDPKGKVWRFADDPVWTWGLVWNDTALK